VNAKVDSQVLRVAQMIRSGDKQSAAIERAPGLYECQGVGNSYRIVTPDGDVMVNTGTLGDAQRNRLLFDAVSGNPVRHIVLTQHHANQYGGLEIYKTDQNQVIAQRRYPDDRHYHDMLMAHYRRGSRRIFAGITGPTERMLPMHEISPDLLFDDHHTFELGGRRFEVLATPGGEALCALVVWLPDERIAVVGNLFGPLFGNQPNLNTVRGDKPRSAVEFIRSIKRVRDLKPELLLTGHEVIHGAERIEREITRIADAVQWVHDRTVEGMNLGIDLRTLMRDVRPPPELTLTEEYGKVAWNVRAIWHEYTGWFDPSRGTTELFAVPASSVATTLTQLAGGADRLAESAQGFVAQGKPLEALHLLDIAVVGDPASEWVKQVKRDALKLLLEQTGGKNLWERMWIAAELRLLDD
jgi:glyoxylase-like metal-dependent hydrolase (beta-lactamase superfamily II)